MSKMLIFCGSDEPHKAFPPFMLAAGALAMDMEVTFFFTMSGLNIIKKGGAEKIVLPEGPKPLPEFLATVQLQEFHLVQRHFGNEPVPWVTLHAFDNKQNKIHQ